MMLADVSWPAKRVIQESAIVSCFVRYRPLDSSGLLSEALTSGPGNIRMCVSI